MTETERTAEPTLHTEIGRGGVIVEMRPVGQDYPSESDMAHLTDEAARDLRDQLNDYLRESDTEPEIDCPYCDSGEMYRDGPKVVCDSCGGVKLA